MMLKTFGHLFLEGTPRLRPKPLLLLCYVALSGPKTRRVLSDVFYGRAKDPRDSLSSALLYLQLHVPDSLTVTAHTISCPLPTDAKAFQILLDEGRSADTLELYRGPFLGDLEVEVAEELEEWILEKREYFATLVRGVHITLAESALAARDSKKARYHAEHAYLTEGAPALEQAEVIRLQRLLERTKSPLLMTFKNEVRDLELTLSAPDKPFQVPLALTSFIGRDVERASLTKLLNTPHVRLVTIHGPAGVGKTRLALQCAGEHRNLPRFADGVFFVGLETLVDATDVPQAVLDVMGFIPDGGGTAAEQLNRQVGMSHFLVILDNFEPFIDARSWVTSFLQSCPNVLLLITSRERLNVEGEWVVTLEGLLLPSDLLGLEDARSVHAIQLFTDRARQAQLSFELRERDLPHARSICKLVGGYPLGLELSAAWAGLYPLEQIARELEQDVMNLSTPLKNFRDRHQSMRSAFEHSWRLLRNEERVVLRQLATFSGGFERQAAEEVTRTTAEMLKGLIDKSLVKVDQQGRFYFHPLIHQFATEKLADMPEELAACRARHSVYFLTLLGPMYEDIMGGPRTRTVLDAIEREASNLRLAWTWGVSERRIDLLHDGIASLGLYCETRGRFQFGIELLSELIENLYEIHAENHFTLGAAYGMKGFLLIRAQSGEAALAMAAKGQALLAVKRLPTRNWALWMALEASVGAHWARGELDKGEHFVRQNLALARSDRHNAQNDMDIRVAEVFAGISLHVLGMFEIIRGHYAKAIPFLEESRDLLDQHSSITLSYTLWNLGQANFYVGELETARATLERGLEMSQALGYNTMVAYILSDLSRVYDALGDHDMAIALCSDIIDTTQRNGDRRLEGTAEVVYGQALIKTNKFDQALSHFRRALELSSPIGAFECATEALAGICLIWAQNGAPQHATVLGEIVRSHQASSAATKEAVENILQALEMNNDTLLIRNTLISSASFEDIIFWVDNVIYESVDDSAI